MLQRAIQSPEVLQWHTWSALAPGPALVVLGAVHGNEVCGAHAIARTADDLVHGRLVLARGRLTLVPVANPLAFGRCTREGRRNLNRCFVPRADPLDYEDRVTRQLAPLLAAHDALLDLHSFHTPGEPFAMVGPRNNTGPREPFAHAGQEMALARALGAQRIVAGWLEVYDRAARARGEQPGDEGIGTNEYMRSQGGYAVTLECGQHEDPQAIEVAERALHGALAELGLAQVEAPARFTGAATRLTDVVLREAPGDRLVRDWRSFDAVQAGDVIGLRADGRPVCAPHAGCVVFPYPEAEAGREWFYLAEPG
jgi:predicted deacylase